MRDKLFLQWIHERLLHVHGENVNVDYMHKLRAIIAATDESVETPNAHPRPTAKEIMAKWPAWKRNYKLTKYCGRTHGCYTEEHY